ncbi:MAG: hypothetical protein JO025_03225 [Verrucomicrobia bacterium]|nr:hypothetical protein [Verrucomicrobiota bacterium]
MKQQILDWVLTIGPESSEQITQSGQAFAGLYPSAKLLSDEGKVLLLAHLYLELRLTVEQALRAARADIMMAPRAQTYRRWEEQPAAHPRSVNKNKSMPFVS